MIRKIGIIAVLLMCGVLCFANDISSYNMSISDSNSKKLDASLQQQHQKYASQGASEEGVVTLKFDIDKTTTGIDDAGHAGEVVHFFDTTRKCSLIKIDDNWLIGSSYCFNFDRYEEYKTWTFNGDTVKEIKNVRLNGEKITSIIKDGSVIYGNNKKGLTPLPLYLQGDIMLVYIGANADLKKEYADLPKANIYIPSKSEYSVADYKGLKFYVSRKSVVFGIREKQEREIGEYCSDTKCIKLKFGLFHAEAMSGDPLFAVAPNNMEFIVAFNTGDFKKDEDQKRSRYFKELNNDSYKAIEKIVSSKDAAAWRRIKVKIAHTPNSFVIKK